MNREQALMPNGVPKWIRCYDNPAFADRYTILFTKKRIDGQFLNLSSGHDPRYCSGWGQSDDIIDRPSYGHLGKKIGFTDLPEPVISLVIETYRDIWNLQKEAQK